MSTPTPTPDRDFFDDLERHLHRAATRNARLGRLGSAPIPRATTLLAATAIAACIALAITVVPSLVSSLGDEERELPAAPAPGDCSDPDPPQATLDTLGVLRRPRTQAEEVPPAELERMLRDVDAAKVWPDRLRVARGEGGYGHMVVPALIGERCDAPAPDGGKPDVVPGACVIESLGGEAHAPTCQTIAEVRRGTPLFVGERGTTHFPVEGEPVDSARTTVTALVPDGSTPVLEVEGRIVIGVTEGNVFVASYSRRSPDEPDARLRLDGPSGDCDRGPTGAPVPEELLKRFGVLRRAQTGADRFDIEGAAASGGAWREVFDQGPYTAGIRLAFERDGRRYWFVPVEQARGVRCELPTGDEPAVPGACAVSSEIGREEEAFAVCGALAELLPAGNLGSVHGFDTRAGAAGMENLAVVPDGFTSARFDGKDVPIAGNVVAARLPGAEVPEEVVLLGPKGPYRVR